MTGCPSLSMEGAGGIAAALRAVDCASGKATAMAFGRLFGVDGQLGLALTALLTLFIGWMAVGLLTGRSRLSLSTLSPRAMTLGLVLTFATSWVAYQSVVWNLAVGAPDEVASLLTGVRGSATLQFAERLDKLFAVIAEAATSAQADGATAAGKSIATPSDILWLGALLLLIGTVGVLLIARITLAALLALGPVFIVLSLFEGTRGLFQGWLRCLAMFALVPLFAVLIGGGALAMIAPVVAGLGMGEPTMRSCVTILLAAIVYCGLMIVVFHMLAALTAAWRTSSSDTTERPLFGVGAPEPPTVGGGNPVGAVVRPAETERVSAIIAGLNPMAGSPPQTSAATIMLRSESLAEAAMQSSVPGGSPSADGRARGIGSQYRQTAPQLPRETYR
ncbi:MAG: type IV secretion system protein [Pseudomonadota bacterium]